MEVAKMARIRPKPAMAREQVVRAGAVEVKRTVIHAHGHDLNSVKGPDGRGVSD